MRASELKNPSSKRAAQIKRALAGAGKFSSGTSDISARHDDYIAEAFAARVHGVRRLKTERKHPRVPCSPRRKQM